MFASEVWKNIQLPLQGLKKNQPQLHVHASSHSPPSPPPAQSVLNGCFLISPNHTTWKQMQVMYIEL